MVCERPALFGSGDAGWPVLRLREYRRGVARHGGGCSRNHALGSRPQPHSPGHADASCASRCAGRSSDDARRGTKARHTDELRAGSSPAAADKRRLTAFFERSFSVDTVRRFKPAAEAYQSVADSLGISIDRLRLVAAHAWDIVGALRAGCAAAFVARPGKVLYPLGPKPDITGPDFRSVATQI